MKFKGRTIDHIVYCVPNLETALDDIESQLGCRPIIGGRHLNNGTKNALLNVGNGCYFEILAIDEENKNFENERWMGIDLIDKPRITRWALKSVDMQMEKSILNSYEPKLAISSQGERVTEDETILNWKMLLPHASPKVELAPFFLDWSDSEKHPTEMLKAECSLESIQFIKAKENTKIQSCFEALFSDFNFTESDEDKIVIELKGPTGIITLE